MQKTIILMHSEAVASSDSDGRVYVTYVYNLYPCDDQ